MEEKQGPVDYLIDIHVTKLVRFLLHSEDVNYMKRTLLSFFASIILLLVISDARASHNRAGEITYRQLSALQYEITLTTFTDVNPGNADRPTATLNFGDNTSDTRPRIEAIIVAPFIQRNRYKFIHTFPGYSTYIISYQDPNRNNGVVNMINSLNTEFYVETQLVINPFLGFNNSPVLLLEPIDFGGLNKLFVHNPNAYDEDGDSLSFKLVACKQNVQEEVFGYKFPTPANGFASVSFDIDPTTGQLTWENPIILGLYNIAIMVEEWRYISSVKRYERVGYIVRDMQIEILETNNHPPVITPLRDTCVLAGSDLSKQIIARDEDNHTITLTATGGPFLLPPPDVISFNQPSSAPGTITQSFNWKTSCNSVRKQPYQIVFKAVDNGFPRLVDLENWQVRVISPPPENLSATAVGSSVILNWDKLDCGKAMGYQVYRKTGASAFVPDVCQTGLPASLGFKLIKDITDINTTTFTDNNDGEGLSIGNNYCYRIVAYFPDGAESIASNETCVTLNRDLPSITRVSINSTSSNTGSDSVQWAKPVQLDTLQYPGPYEYRVYRITATNPGPVLLQTYSAQFLGDLNDSVLTDNALNTLNEQYTYVVDLWANAARVGSSKSASSIFIRAEGFDNRIQLNFDVKVPWSIDSFEVYRQNPVSGSFMKIGISLSNSYIDSGLTNGMQYCYFVRSFGKYSSGGFAEPLINNSQETCGIPVDNEKPCPPELSVVPSCGLYKNELTWTNPNDFCADDVVKYRVYQSKFVDGEFSLITELLPATLTSFTHSNLTESIAGCYFVTAIDSFDNESNRSNMVCVDNCPKYAFPNVFTPNGDGTNDLFTPIKDSVDFISKVTVTIFNRWGGVVYKTNDPMVLWDGQVQSTKQAAPEGVYYYTVEFSEIRVQGLRPKTISGFVHLLR